MPKPTYHPYDLMPTLQYPSVPYQWGQLMLTADLERRKLEQLPEDNDQVQLAQSRLEPIIYALHYLVRKKWERSHPLPTIPHSGKRKILQKQAEILYHTMLLAQELQLNGDIEDAAALWIVLIRESVLIGSDGDTRSKRLTQMQRDNRYLSGEGFDRRPDYRNPFDHQASPHTYLFVEMCLSRMNGEDTRKNWENLLKARRELHSLISKTPEFQPIVFSESGQPQIPRSTGRGKKVLEPLGINQTRNMDKQIKEIHRNYSTKKNTAVEPLPHKGFSL